MGVWWVFGPVLGGCLVGFRSEFCARFAGVCSVFGECLSVLGGCFDGVLFYESLPRFEFVGALRVFPGGNQVDGLPPASSFLSKKI